MNRPGQFSPGPQDVGKFGLQVQELTKEVAERLHVPVEQGVVVTDVEDNSIAAAQDIQREDVITEVDGKPVTNLQSFREALNKADPKRGVLLYLDRKGTKTFAVLKAERLSFFRLPTIKRTIPPTRQMPLATGRKSDSVTFLVRNFKWA